MDNKVRFVVVVPGSLALALLSDRIFKAGEGIACFVDLANRFYSNFSGAEAARRDAAPNNEALKGEARGTGGRYSFGLQFDSDSVHFIYLFNFAYLFL